MSSSLQTESPARVESPDQRAVSPATSLALVAVFAALCAVFSLMPAIPVGGVGVPITLQTLAVMLCGLVLGPKRGPLAVLLWLILGFAGLPIFSGGAGGLGVFAKPSIGYLLSFPLAALAAGLVSRATASRRPRWLWLFLSALCGSFFVHLLGITGMALIAHLSAPAAVGAGIVFLPGDLIKDAVAAFIAAQVFRAFPGMLRA